MGEGLLSTNIWWIVTYFVLTCSLGIKELELRQRGGRNVKGYSFFLMFGVILWSNFPWSELYVDRMSCFGDTEMPGTAVV